MLRRLVFLLLVPTLLASCVLPGSVSETPTPSPAPTVSPTPAPPLVILVLPTDLPQPEYDRYQTLVYDMAQEAGMRFQVRNTLTVDELRDELPALKIVVALPPDPGLAALTAAAPAVQFLAIGVPGLPAAANLSTVGSSGLPVDQQAFLAGYIVALLAPEWRVGILTRRDTLGGEAARTAFTNGFRFYCGKCWNSNFTMPIYDYPIVVRIPEEAQEGEYTGYARVLLDYWARAAFVYPEVATPEVLAYMAQNGLLLVGQELPGEDVRPYWIASIQPDMIAAVRGVFPDLVAGQGGQVVPTPLFLTEVNPNLLTDAKLRLAQEILAGLQNGTIGTGVTP